MEAKQLYRVKQGQSFGVAPHKKGGQTVELKPSEAADFLDVLEPISLVGSSSFLTVSQPSDEGESGEVGTDALPDKFPYRAKLVAANFTTLSAVNLASDEELEAIKGIGLEGVTKIRAALG